MCQASWITYEAFFFSKEWGGVDRIRANAPPAVARTKNHRQRAGYRAKPGAVAYIGGQNPTQPPDHRRPAIMRRVQRWF